jgi:hypothetical protein
MNSLVGDNPMHHIRVNDYGNYQVRMYIDGEYWYATFDTLDEAVATRDTWMKQQE